MIDPMDVYIDLGGESTEEYIPTRALYTNAGTPFLQTPGVALIAKTQMLSLSHGILNFIEEFDPELSFLEYLLDDVTRLTSGAALTKFAGQLCYMSFGPGRTKNADAQRYLDHIKESGHGSVFEHTNLTFLLYGISRSLTHELVRHRAGFGFSQVSQRYVSGKVLRFVERPEYRNVPPLHDSFMRRIDFLAEEYGELTEKLLELQKEEFELLSGEGRTEMRKKVQQSARSTLPNETEAPIVVTANVRSWRHFIEMRCNGGAETEIRGLALRIFLCLLLAEPLLFSDYSLVKLNDGTYVVETPWRKV